eukprot:3540062-Lingulodinium_polyedra.AAC.1
MVESARAPECHPPLESHPVRVAYGHRKEDGKTRLLVNQQRLWGILFLGTLQRERHDGFAGI